MAKDDEFDAFIDEVEAVPRADAKEALSALADAERELTGNSVIADGIYKMTEAAHEYLRLKEQLEREQAGDK